MLCDGAKSSCAGKISIAIEAGLQGLDMALAGNSYISDDGLVRENPEKTIESIGLIAREGMRETDKLILETLIK